MQERIEELEEFKSFIDLREYAVWRGYALDRQTSSRSYAVLEHPNGDKIFVGKDHDGDWIYFSVRDDADHGSVIDFVQRRDGGNLGEVRKELHAFFGAEGSPALLPTAPVKPVTKDLLRVRARFEAMTPINGRHAYLEEVRKIPASVLSLPRFSDRIRIDSHDNAIFPHWNSMGISGYEMKNENFTGFSPGGEKGVWSSRRELGDSALVIAETAIDALSHFALMHPEATRYASIAGTLNPIQPELLRRVAKKLPSGGRVILATDNDEGGDRLALGIREALASLLVQIVEERPSKRGQNWNDVLRQSPYGIV